MSLSPMPKGAPMVNPSTGVIGEDWSVYLTKTTDIIRAMERPQTVESNNETCTVVRVGCLAFWTYTGLGGVTFTFQGAPIVVPVSTTPVTSSGHVIIGGDNAR